MQAHLIIYIVITLIIQSDAYLTFFNYTEGVNCEKMFNFAP